MAWVRSAFALAGTAVVLAGCGAGGSTATSARTTTPASTIPASPISTSTAPASTATSGGLAARATEVVNAPTKIAHTAAGSVGYREVGAGSPVVLIMGLGGSIDDWQPAFVAGLAADHTVIAFDNAGVGQTAALPAPLSITAMANQASALISALYKISGGMEQIPQRDLRSASSELAAFYIFPPKAKQTFASMFATHPTLEQRVKALEHYEAKLQGTAA